MKDGLCNIQDDMAETRSAVMERPVKEGTWGEDFKAPWTRMWFGFSTVGRI